MKVQLFTESLPELAYRAQPEQCSRSENEIGLECVAVHAPPTDFGAANHDADLKRREIIERRFQRRHARRGHAAARGQACGSRVDHHALHRMNLGRCSSFSAQERNAFRVYAFTDDSSRVRLCNVFNAAMGMTM